MYIHLRFKVCRSSKKSHSIIINPYFLTHFTEKNSDPTINMNCPCGSDNCTKTWCFNNWLQCRICGDADHEDHFYGSGLFHIPIQTPSNYDDYDTSNRDPIICGSCMINNFFCIKCRKLKPKNKAFSCRDKDSGICKKCLHHYADFINLFRNLDDDKCVDLMSDALDGVR